ncbi:MAG: dinitrogenase iron-molybdenum cofactor [Candidatus Cloacimonetes bacterium]|nr:dinitrogenase iron-molybdenum cofactor [Candidatus Cloacimonadota bacterium]
MIIAFASDDKNGLDGVLAYHFGRCPYFTFVEVDKSKVKDVRIESNPYMGSHDVGVVPEYIHRKGGEMIVAGGMGPRAQEWFAKLGVKPMVGAYGRIKDVVEEIIKHPVEVSTFPTSPKEIESGESDEAERLKKEVAHLRETIADLNERLKKLEDK